MQKLLCGTQQHVPRSRCWGAPRCCWCGCMFRFGVAAAQIGVKVWVECSDRHPNQRRLGVRQCQGAPRSPSCESAVSLGRRTPCWFGLRKPTGPSPCARIVPRDSGGGANSFEMRGNLSAVSNKSISIVRYLARCARDLETFAFQDVDHVDDPNGMRVAIDVRHRDDLLVLNALGRCVLILSLLPRL